MISLKKVLQAHDKYSHLSTLPNLGDGFLIKKNTIYSNIRKVALKVGYRYTSKHYAKFNIHRLSYLPTIYKTKRIPYCNNVKILKKILMHGLAKMNWADLTPPSSNYLLHESCHGIARHIVHTNFTNTAKRNSRAISPSRQLALTTLMEEAFANTCEALSYAEARTPDHRIFLNQNNYRPTELRPNQLSSFLKRFDFPIVFSILFLSYLHANFLFQELSLKQLKSSLSVIDECFGLKKPVKLTNKDLKELKVLFDSGLVLSIGFRLQTNTFFFKLIGIRMDIFDLLNFNFLTIFKKDKRYMNCMHQMCDVAQNGILKKSNH